MRHSGWAAAPMPPPSASASPAQRRAAMMWGGAGAGGVSARSPSGSAEGSHVLVMVRVKALWRSGGGRGDGGIGDDGVAIDDGGGDDADPLSTPAPSSLSSSPRVREIRTAATLCFVELKPSDDLDNAELLAFQRTLLGLEGGAEGTPPPPPPLPSPVTTLFPPHTASPSSQGAVATTPAAIADPAAPRRPPSYFRITTLIWVLRHVLAHSRITILLACAPDTVGKRTPTACADTLHFGTVLCRVPPPQMHLANNNNYASPAALTPVRPTGRTPTMFDSGIVALISDEDVAHLSPILFEEAEDDDDDEDEIENGDKYDDPRSSSPIEFRLQASSSPTRPQPLAPEEEDPCAIHPIVTLAPPVLSPTHRDGGDVTSPSQRPTMADPTFDRSSPPRRPVLVEHPSTMTHSLPRDADGSIRSLASPARLPMDHTDHFSTSAGSYSASVPSAPLRIDTPPQSARREYEIVPTSDRSIAIASLVVPPLLSPTHADGLSPVSPRKREAEVAPKPESPIRQYVDFVAEHDVNSELRLLGHVWHTWRVFISSRPSRAPEVLGAIGRALFTVLHRYCYKSTLMRAVGRWKNVALTLRLQADHEHALARVRDAHDAHDAASRVMAMFVRVDLRLLLRALRQWREICSAWHSKHMCAAFLGEMLGRDRRSSLRNAIAKWRLGAMLLASDKRQAERDRDAALRSQSEKQALGVTHLRHFLSSGTHRSMLQGFKTWRAAVRDACAAEQELAKKERLVRKTLARALEKDLAASLEQWRRFVKAHQQSQQIILRMCVLFGAECRWNVAAAWSRWIDMMSLQDACHRVLHRMTQIKLKCGLMAWTKFVAEREQACLGISVARRLIQRLSHKSLSRGFHSWWLHTEHRRTTQHDAAHRFFLLCDAKTRRELARAWRSWRGSIAQLIDSYRIVARVVRQMSHEWLTCAFRTWRAAITRLTAYERAYCCLQRMTQSRCHIAVLRAFETWRIVDQANKNAHRDAAHRFFIFCDATTRRNLARAWRTWRALQMQSINAHRIIAHVVRQLTHASFSRAFRMWQAGIARITAYDHACCWLQRMAHGRRHTSLMRSFEAWRTSTIAQAAELRINAMTEAADLRGRRLRVVDVLFASCRLRVSTAWSVWRRASVRLVHQNLAVAQLWRVARRVCCGTQLRWFWRWRRTLLDANADVAKRQARGVQLLASDYRRHIADAWGIWRRRTRSHTEKSRATAQLWRILVRVVDVRGEHLVAAWRLWARQTAMLESRRRIARQLYRVLLRSCKALTKQAMLQWCAHMHAMQQRVAVRQQLCVGLIKGFKRRTSRAVWNTWLRECARRNRGRTAATQFWRSVCRLHAKRAGRVFVNWRAWATAARPFIARSSTVAQLGRIALAIARSHTARSLGRWKTFTAVTATRLRAQRDLETRAALWEAEAVRAAHYHRFKHPFTSERRPVPRYDVDDPHLSAQKQAVQTELQLSSMVFDDADVASGGALRIAQQSAHPLPGVPAGPWRGFLPSGPACPYYGGGDAGAPTHLHDCDARGAAGARKGRNRSSCAGTAPGGRDCSGTISNVY